MYERCEHCGDVLHEGEVTALSKSEGLCEYCYNQKISNRKENIFETWRQSKTGRWNGFI